MPFKYNQYEIPQQFIPANGDVIGNYRIINYLGNGSYGYVYKVLNMNDMNFYALKILKLWQIAYEEERKRVMTRFEREFETGSKIRSDYLVRAHDIGIIRGNPYLVMEFCGNGDLQKRIKDKLPIDYIHNRACEILLGLRDLHNSGKNHRDLKPENVMLSNSGHAKLTDFGCSGDINVRLTRRGEGFGTWAYMPFELEKSIDKHVTVTPVVDIFSFGVMIYEIFTNTYPFGKLDTIGEIADYRKRVQLEKWDDIRNYRRDVPDKWVEVIEKCFYKDFRKRHQNVDEILAKLGNTVIKEESPVNSVKNVMALQVMQGIEYGTIYNLLELLQFEECGLLTVGRDDLDACIINDLNIIERPCNDVDYYISRQHATIEKKMRPEEGWYIRDGQWIDKNRRWKYSCNKTYVNSHEIIGEEIVKLNPNDIITLGDTTLKVILI